jgi:sugar phosphate isomerase/epimerase
MYLTGFADEAAGDIDGQIKAITTLGWKNIECRNIDGTNLTTIDDATFEKVCEKLSAAGIHVNCFGSGIANWSQKLEASPEPSYRELARAIPRMHALGTKLIRVMSFACDPGPAIDEPCVVSELITRMKRLTSMAEDGGVILVHENCSGWAGHSHERTLRMLDAIASKHLKLVFDTGNPVFEKDVRGAPPYRYQDAWEFYSNVKEHIVYVHIKDGKVVDGKMRFTFPGEGDGSVRRIITDLHARGYDGGFSMEPHMAAVVHDPSVQSEASVRFDNFVEYGRRFERMARQIGFQMGSA